MPAQGGTVTTSACTRTARALEPEVAVRFDADAVVWAGGEPIHPRWQPLRVSGAPLVVAADGGLDHASAAGMRVDLVVGDLDSVGSEALERAATSGAAVERHPRVKDETDLELALRAVTARGMRRVLLVGLGGGTRADHLLGNLLLLGAPVAAGLELRALAGPALVTVVRSSRTLHGPPGSLVSLLPLGGTAAGVRTEGLRWALDGDDLTAGTSRGMSNEMLGGEARVGLRDGVLLAIQPTEGTP